MYFGLSHLALVAAMLPTLTGAILDDLVDANIAFIQRVGSANVLDGVHRVSSDDTAGLYNVETVEAPLVAGDCDRRGLCASSKGYPSRYGNSERCTISYPSNAWLKFTDFITENSFDKLRINGQDYSGSVSPPINPYFQATGEIRWTTDNTGTTNGWEICESYSVSGDCDASNNCVSSKNYPSMYGNRSSCSISVASGMELRTEHFETEVTHDQLRIDGSVYSGTQGPPAVFNSGAGGTTITWTTDSAFERKGWKLCFVPPTPSPTPSPPTPSPAAWYLGQQNATCHDVCSQFGSTCREDVWPTRLRQFDEIRSQINETCTSLTRGVASFNPALNPEHGGCFWFTSRGGNNRCGFMPPYPWRRFCPCAMAPVLADAGPLQLETNSLGGDGGLLRFSNVFLDGTELVVENTTEYTPFKANVTGLAAPLSSLAQISLGCGETVEMNFEFILDSQPVIPSAFNFTVADLDKGTQDRCLESVEMSDWNAYFLYPDQVSSSINMTETAGRLRFTGLTRGSVEDNPVNMFNMTTEQKMKAVTFLVEGKNGFTMKFATIDPEESSTDPDVVGYNGRRILFGLGNP